MELAKLKNIIEGALLAAGETLSKERIMQLFEEDAQPEDELFEEAIKSLQEDCEGRSVELKRVASGYRYQVKEDVGEWVSRLWAEKPQRYSRALLETIALIAYRQPITRGEIEEIRGVAVSTHIIKTLQEREWVRVVGHRDVPGRPAMYATTKTFLDYFDMASLEELPSLQEIRDLDKINQELNLEGEEPNASESADTSEEVASEESGQQDLVAAAAWEEPEDDVDPADLLADEEVDAVLRSVEESFRKPKADEDTEVAADTEAEEESSEIEERIEALENEVFLGTESAFEEEPEQESSDEQQPEADSSSEEVTAEVTDSQENVSSDQDDDTGESPEDDSETEDKLGIH